MKNANVTVSIVTPCILAGTDQEKAEIRPASIRGQLRWWFRLLKPSQTQDETRIFGGIHNGARASSLVVRTVVENNFQVRIKQKAKDIAGSDFDYILWPLGRNNSTPRGVIIQGQSFQLVITHKFVSDNKYLPPEVLKAFLFFGSLGTRSRRAYGSIYPKELSIDGQACPIPRTVEDFTNEAKKILPSQNFTILQLGTGQPNPKQAIDICAEFLKKFRCGSSKSGTPSKWGANDHDAPFSNNNSSVFRPILGLPLEQRYSKDDIVTSFAEIAEKRWASPLLLKVLPLENQFFPVAIFCDLMLLPANRITLDLNRRTVNKSLSKELWETMKNPDNPEHKKIWKSSKKIL